MAHTQPPPSRQPASESTPAGRNMSEWFRQADRFVRTVRTFGDASPNALAARERAIEHLLGVLDFHAPLTLHCTPLELWLGDEAVVRAPAGGEGEIEMERRLPFLLYRDGIRTLTFARETTRADATALLDALARVATQHATHEDLVTLLWEADLAGLRIDLAPLHQSFRPRGGADAAVLPGPADVADALPAPAANGEPLPAFADWPLPANGTEPATAWRALAPVADEARAELRARWERERSGPWSDGVGRLVDDVLAVANDADTQIALAHALVTWLAGSLQRCEWREAGEAIAALGRVDPDGARSAAPLTSVLQSLDAEAIAERLDESEPDAQAQCFALAVRIGRPALDLMVGVLATATRVRLRAAATTALAYLCADEPTALARYLADSRWYLVRNIVFVLGQIGGSDIVPLLAGCARHGDARVRRAVVHALGQVPPAERQPLLAAVLESDDAQTVSAALAMLARDAGPGLTAVVLERVTALDFEQRHDDVKSALIAALGDTADDSAIEALGSLVQKGGWFARRTAERAAAAQALARIGSPRALAVLHAGLQSRAEAIRACCQEALARQHGPHGRTA